MQRMKAYATKALGVAAVVATALSASPASAKPDQLTIYGGPWLATELQKSGVKANSELGGALSNLIQISRSPENMGITFAAAAPMAYAGVKPFPAPVKDFCGLQLLQRSAFHALVSEGSGVASAGDLKGKTFSGQAVGNLSQVALAKDFMEKHAKAEGETA